MPESLGIQFSEKQDEESALQQTPAPDEQKTNAQKKTITLNFMIICFLGIVFMLIILQKMQFDQKRMHREVLRASIYEDINQNQITELALNSNNQGAKPYIIEEQVQFNRLQDQIRSYELHEKDREIAEKQISKNKLDLIQEVDASKDSIKTKPKSPKQNKILNAHIQSRLKKIKSKKAIYERRYKTKLKTQLIVGSSITGQKFLRSMSLAEVTGQTKMAKDLNSFLDQEYKYYEKTYKISKYKELPFCIVVPTFKNFNEFRYYYNIESILKQNYTNFHVVIVDDFSGDGTAQGILQYLKTNNISEEKVVLRRNMERRFHMQNIYESVMEHCKSGEILMIIDGDDELLGRQVFKLFNAQYHTKKMFAIYSNYLRSVKENQFFVGISLPYPEKVKQANTYRTSKHYYSHLRSCFVDLFFQINPELSFKDSNGVWYDNSVDNAIFFSIFEMTCSKTDYLPEITYKYNTFTGFNIQGWNKNQRKITTNQIKLSEQYECINNTNPEIYTKLQKILLDQE